MVDEKEMTIEVIPLAKSIFWVVLFFILLLFFVFTAFSDEKQAEYYTAWAEAENNPAYCENIKTLQRSSQCYAVFVQQGFSCKELAKQSNACLFAEAVLSQSDLACDLIFPEQVTLNLECRVSVFIERYTNEGLSDCCHIK